MPEIKVGDIVRVVDASAAKGGKRPKFGKDQELRVIAVSPVAGLHLAGFAGWWRSTRFERVRRG